MQHQTQIFVASSGTLLPKSTVEEAVQAEARLKLQGKFQFTATPCFVVARNRHPCILAGLFNEVDKGVSSVRCDVIVAWGILRTPVKMFAHHQSNEELRAQTVRRKELAREEEAAWFLHQVTTAVYTGRVS